MITGVWVSPDGESMAIQFDEDSIYRLEPGRLDLTEDVLGGVPDGWHTLRDWSEVG